MSIINDKQLELQLLAAIVEGSEDGIISKSLDGQITSWNKGAEKIFGYTKEEAIGRNIRMLIPKEQLSEEDYIIDKIKKGERVEHYETVRVAKDGRRLTLSLTISPIRDSEGNIIGASKISRDITEKIRIENELKKYNEKLEELNKYKDQFMAIASHELKTPVTVIKANLQFMEMQMQGDEMKVYVDKMMKQINKLSNLISDLLDVTKIQAGKLEFNKTDFDLVELTNEVVDNLQATNNHQVIKEFPEQSCMIHADRIRLEQVIVNLLTNSVKYSPKADKIIISVKKENDDVIFAVKDFGIGIPKDEEEKIFTRFYRVEGLPSTFKGSGIGLYISNEIVKGHKGKIWVSSTLGEGSEFYFRIPSNTQ
jgi:PAS domain S-box-containing protein